MASTRLQTSAPGGADFRSALLMSLRPTKGYDNNGAPIDFPVLLQRDRKGVDLDRRQRVFKGVKCPHAGGQEK